MELLKISKEFISEFRSKLKKVGYTEKNFSSVGIVGSSRYLPRYKLMIDKRLEEEGDIGTLIKLFFFGDAIDKASVRKFFTKSTIGELLKTGILKKSGGKLVSEIKITPYAGYLFASDFVTKYKGAKQKRNDLVFPISVDSADLMSAAVKTKSKNTLDICCGCGFHAILLAKTSGHVIGSDINPRAIEFARFNALLNGIKNVEFRTGNLYEPVKGLKFDHIISNPPYETSATTKSILGNGGELGRDAWGVIINRLPEFLNDGGICQLVAKIFLKKNETIEEVLKRYLKGPYAVLFQHKYSTDIYDEIYSRYENVEHFDKYLERVNDLTRNYARLGIGGTTYGLINIKKAKKSSFVQREFHNVYILPKTPADIVGDFFR